MPAAYVLALIPVKLTLLRVATPEAFVVAPPTEVPLRVNEILFPFTPFPPDVSVAERFTVPPYVPVAKLTDREVAACVELIVKLLLVTVVRAGFGDAELAVK